MKQTEFKPEAISAGSKAWGYVKVVDHLAISCDMPVMVINGAADGPTFTVTAGLYPLEFCGVEAASRLYQAVDPSQLAGKLVIVPVVNMPVLQFRTPMFALTQSLTPMDGKNINTCFPGDPAGSLTEVIAHKLFQDVILGSDYHVDLRGGDLIESHLAHTIFLTGVGDLDDTLREMGVIFGLKYCLSSRTDIGHTLPGTLVYEAIAHGVPSIISESGLGFNTQPSEAEVMGHVTGVLNLLTHYKMLDGEVERPAEQFYLQPDRIRVRTPVAGIFKHIPDQGDEVVKGQLIGTIVDLDGEILSEIIAPCDAVVHEMLPRRLVYPNDMVYSLAVVAGVVG